MKRKKKNINKIDTHDEINIKTVIESQREGTNISVIDIFDHFVLSFKNVLLYVLKKCLINVHYIDIFMSMAMVVGGVEGKLMLCPGASETQSITVESNK